MGRLRGVGATALYTFVKSFEKRIMESTFENLCLEAALLHCVHALE